jgi:hypothetical protein
MLDILRTAKDIASSKAFKWMAGMKVVDSFRVTESYLPFMHSTDIPDIQDPATFGCLLKLARDKLNDPTWFPCMLDDGTEIMWLKEKPSKEAQTRYGSEISVIERVLNGK